MNKKVLLILAAILVIVGITKPDLQSIFKKKPNNVVVVVDDIVVITPPADEDIKKACDAVKNSLLSGPESRHKDGKRLANLYLDLATLIELDSEDEVVKTTEEIRQANSMTGILLKLNAKDKYPNLAETMHNVVVTAIGDDHTVLSPGLRAKAVEAFRGLAWACNEGAK
jgi:hypothetical protein